MDHGFAAVLPAGGRRAYRPPAHNRGPRPVTGPFPSLASPAVRAEARPRWSTHAPTASLRGFQDASPSTWCPPIKAVLIGVGGSGMRAAAEFLRDAGTDVIGYDAEASALRDWAAATGVKLADRGEGGPFSGGETPDLLIRSAAIPDNDPRVRHAAAAGCPTRTYPEWLGDLSRQIPTVCVAGTHGKTTTAALLRTALGECSFLIGGASRGDGRSGRYVPEAPLVMEACEYRRHFLNLRPHAACVLGSELDHPDFYATPADVTDSFEDFRQNVRQLVVADAAYGWDGPRIRPQALSVPNLGRHLSANADAAVTTALELGVGESVVRERLRGFEGVSRRYEVIDEGPTRWIDDYAHHPTSVRLTIEEARRTAAGRPVVAAFEPHQAGRLQAFEREFAEALSLAGHTFLLPTFAARESCDGGRAVRLLADRLGRRASLAADLDQLRALFQTRLTRDPACVALILGAGRIGRFLDEQFPHLRRT